MHARLFQLPSLNHSFSSASAAAIDGQIPLPSFHRPLETPVMPFTHSIAHVDHSISSCSPRRSSLANLGRLPCHLTINDFSVVLDGIQGDEARPVEQRRRIKRFAERTSHPPCSLTPLPFQPRPSSVLTPIFSTNLRAFFEMTPYAHPRAFVQT